MPSLPLFSHSFFKVTSSNIAHDLYASMTAQPPFNVTGLVNLIKENCPELNVGSSLKVWDSFYRGIAGKTGVCTNIWLSICGELASLNQAGVNCLSEQVNTYFQNAEANCPANAYDKEKYSLKDVVLFTAALVATGIVSYELAKQFFNNRNTQNELEQNIDNRIASLRR